MTGEQRSAFERLRTARQQLRWTTTLFADVPALMFDYGARPLAYLIDGRRITDLCGWALETRGGFRLRNELTDLPPELRAGLLIGGDHMEADWLGNREPDTFEGLTPNDQPWIALARRHSLVLVAYAPGLTDHRETDLRGTWIGITHVLAPVGAS